MTDSIHAALRPIRRRQRRLVAVESAVWGLMLGSLVAVLLGASPIVGWPTSTSAVLGVLAAGAMVGMLVGYARGWTWHRTAVAVDGHCRLKDRAVTALALSRRDESTIHQLQITDAVEHLKQVDAREVIPLAAVRMLPVALVSLLVAATLLLVPRTEAKSVPVTLPHIQAEGRKLEQTMLQDIQQLAQQAATPELKQLVEQIRQLVSEMEGPGVDQREALATLSEMQAAIAAAQAQTNLKAVEAQLRALGEALAAAKTSEAAAQALREGDFDKASQALEQLDVSQMTRLETQTLAEKLKDLAGKMKDAKQDPLSEATENLSEGLHSADAKQADQAARQLAGICRQQSLRQAIDQHLALQLTVLAESKLNCRNGNSGGLARKQSDRPSNTWGKGTAGQAEADRPTQLDSRRRRVEITGTMGQGPSQRETSRTAEGHEAATRGYRQQYQKYRRMTEAVLQSEALPLGHRQTIRRYFESIRPAGQAGNRTATARPGGETE